MMTYDATDPYVMSSVRSVPHIQINSAKPTNLSIGNSHYNHYDKRCGSAALPLNNMLSFDQYSRQYSTPSPNARFNSAMTKISSLSVQSDLNSAGSSSSASTTRQQILYASSSSSSTGACGNQLSLDTELSVKQFFSSQLTEVLVCPVLAQMSIRSHDAMNKTKSSTKYNKTYSDWVDVGCGWLTALGLRDHRLPTKIIDVALQLCRPLTYRSLWHGLVPMDGSKKFDKKLTKSKFVLPYCVDQSDELVHNALTLSWSPDNSTTNSTPSVRNQSRQLFEVRIRFEADSDDLSSRIKVGEFANQVGQMISQSKVYRTMSSSARNKAIKSYNQARQKGGPLLSSKRSKSAVVGGSGGISHPVMFRHIHSISRADFKSLQVGEQR